MHREKGKKGILIISVAIILIFLAVYLGVTWYNYSRRPQVSTDSIAVLAYHRIVPDNVKKQQYPDDKWTVGLSDFQKQMEYLNDERYQTISAKQFEGWYDGQNEFLKKTVMLTFDDGDYELYYLVLPILQKYHMKATAFLIGADITDTTPAYNQNERHNIGLDVITKVRKDYPYLDFQSHTYDLHKKYGFYGIAYETNYDDLLKDFAKNKEFGFEYLAYPYGDFSPNIQKAAQESGIKMAFKFKIREKATRDDNKFEIPRVKIASDMDFDDFCKQLGGNE